MSKIEGTIFQANQLVRWLPILIMAIGLLSIANFISGSFNIKNLLLLNHQISILCLISLGSMVVFYAGEFDLSVGSTFALGITIIGLLYSSYPLAFIVFLLLILVCFIGTLNTFLSLKVGPALIVTFITMHMLRGIVFLLTDGVPLTQYHIEQEGLLFFLGWNTLFGTPIAVYLVILITIGLHIFFQYTYSGQNLQAVGINPLKAELLSINPSLYKLAAFIFGAFIAILAGLIYYSRIVTVSPSAGNSFAFEALAAIIISNGDLKPSSPSPWAVVITATLLTLYEHYLSILGFSIEAIHLLFGIFIIIALANARWRVSS